MVKILAIGKSGRLDCIADALFRSSRPKKLYILSEVRNPGLSQKAKHVELGKTDSLQDVEAFALKVKPDFVVIGPEEPLAAGVVDMLKKYGIPCVGPTRLLAQLESSKSFTRALLAKYGIPVNPEYRVFRSLDGIESYLRERETFVVKPDGLTGGKGVKVSGEHLHSVKAAVQYCRELFTSGHPAVIIEEKLDGEEFSFQSFCDGQHMVDTIPVQDHKRIGVGDTGANTGGMGSYSCADHGLPFLSLGHIQQASRVNASVAQALRQELGEEYKGILYGGFILTKDGLRILEYNARFGDPEVMNVLPLLRTDFIDVCEAIINGTLDTLSVVFERKATVCKYVVPQGYPTDPMKGKRIEEVPEPTARLRVYYAAVNKEQDGIYLTGSRAIAFVGIGDTLEEAEAVAEDAASRVGGYVYHRKDIGTRDLIQQRIDHVKKILEK